MKKIFILLLFTSFSGLLNAQNYKIEDGALILSSPILFETGSDKLKPESDKAIDEIKAFLNDRKDITLLRIEGYYAYDIETVNQSLSEKRAMAICRALVARGIACSRLIAVGFGNTKPIKDNSTADGKAANTRIAVKMAALKGRPVGGMPVDGGGKIAGDACR
jgi:OOP family OmpA-OmpF porin